MSTFVSKFNPNPKKNYAESASYTNMFASSYIQHIPHIRTHAESKLKLTNDTRSKILGIPSLK